MQLDHLRLGQSGRLKTLKKILSEKMEGKDGRGMGLRVGEDGRDREGLVSATPLLFFCFFFGGEVLYYLLYTLSHLRK